MAKRDDVFPSHYLKVTDLGGKAFVVTITAAPLETLKGTDGKEQTKTVLSFKLTKKVLPLNVTNWDSVAAITGEDDSDNWAGHDIELYPSTTHMQGKTVDCIRIRAPGQIELPKPKSKAKPKPDPVDDMGGDSVPW
jgi:hypothetical protein